jgi:hypothetical protein
VTGTRDRRRQTATTIADHHKTSEATTSKDIAASLHIAETKATAAIITIDRTQETATIATNTGTHQARDIPKTHPGTETSHTTDPAEVTEQEEDRHHATPASTQTTDQSRHNHIRSCLDTTALKNTIRKVQNTAKSVSHSTTTMNICVQHTPDGTRRNATSATRDTISQKNVTAD